MNRSNSIRSALGFGGAVALLAGCCGSQNATISAAPQIGAPQSRAAAAPSHQHRTFKYIGAPQTFTVPTGVTHVTVRAYGGSSGSTYGGGYVKARIPVTPGESLSIFVGGNSNNGEFGSFNGGGKGGSNNAEGGAGASDVRQGGNALANRVIVAGGEGGNGGENSNSGGAGGGLVGGNGLKGPGQFG